MELSRQQHWAQKQIERAEAEQAEKNQREAEQAQQKADLLAKKYDISNFFKPNTNAILFKAKLEKALGKEIQKCFIKRQDIEIINEVGKINVKILVWADGNYYICHRMYFIKEFAFKSIPVTIGDVFQECHISTPEMYLKAEVEQETIEILNWEEEHGR